MDRQEQRELCRRMVDFTESKGLDWKQGKLMRAKLRAKYNEGITDLQQAWESLQSPPEPEPEVEESPQEDP